MDTYNSYAERDAAIAAGQTSARNSTVHDADKHYAVMAYHADGSWEVHRNLTGTDHDSLDAATEFAQRWAFGPYPDGVDGYGVARI